MIDSRPLEAVPVTPLTRTDLREAVGLFLQLNVWLVIGSVLMVMVTAAVLAVPIEELGIGLCLPAFLVYVAYVHDRRQIPDEDRINHPYRTHLVEKYAQSLHATELLAICLFELVLLTTLPLGRPASWVILVFAHLPIGVLYVYPHLKGNPGLDSLAVAIAWAYLVVFAVLVRSGDPISTPVVGVFLGWLAIVFAGVESRNIDDYQGDAQVGNDTLATRIGPTWTKLLEWTLKCSGVGLLWSLGGNKVAVFVISYLLFLRIARALAEHDNESYA